MSITEAQRHQLYESLRVHLGEAEAETFMNMQSPFDWEQVATKSDIAQLRAELRAELRGDINSLESRLLRTFGTWLFASQAAVIAAMAVLLAILR